ncbi:LSM domain family protein [Babesia bovis T2Bo]|uniref:LSM domain containing protein n=1 Tax=Babesia bovis TaxID=5865 RepID=A7ARL9_BABBO|nr:LSM domain family protein [Babesia bovis T2Bo]EDO07188.1 LSM domain family protein [Babesia bovis T2Bo]|eukprot:XP_001610756.1 LSM domain containing protein [Babesia bovis T2Bo]
MDGGRLTDQDDHLSKQQWIWVLEDELGSLIWVTLRDETSYVGIFKSFDQYGNIFLTDSVRKVIVQAEGVFSDVYNGNLIIRGESIAYFCSLDAESYLNTFKYDGAFDCARIRKIARKRGNAPSIPSTISPLRYIPLDDALRMLKEYQDRLPVRPGVLNDMMGNDAYV